MHSLLSSFTHSPAPVLAEIFGVGSITGIELGLIMGLAGMLFGGVMAVLGIQSENEKRRQRNELIRLALEKGQPIPPEVLGSPADAAEPKDPVKRSQLARRTGIILLASAVALYLFFRGMGMGALVWIAAFPAAIGVAHMINWQWDETDRRRREREAAANPADHKPAAPL